MGPADTDSEQPFDPSYVFDPDRDVTMHADFGKSFICEMPVEAWISVTGHPRQRNTERHAKAAHWKKAAECDGAAKDALRHVDAAVLNGDWFKVDAHTRALKWARGELDAPETVIVNCYRVETKDELNNLYATYDNLSASEKSFEKGFGALRAAGIELQGTRLKSGYVMTPLQIALGAPIRGGAKAEDFDIYRAVESFGEELKMLDELQPDTNIFSAGVIASALIGFTLHPRETEFYRRLTADEGIKQGPKRDPVEAALAEIRQLKQEGGARHRKAHTDLAARVLNAYLTFVAHGPEDDDYWFKSKLRAIDLEPKIAQVRASKGYDPVS